MLSRQVGVVEFLTIFLAPTPFGLGAIVRQVQGSIAAQFGNQMKAALLHHLHAIVVAKGTVQDAISQLQLEPNHLQHGLDHLLEL